MGQLQSLSKMNFEDILQLQNTDHILINTMRVDFQDTLILNTTPCTDEVEIINNLIKNKYNSTTKIIIYGLNYSDETIYKKYAQLHTHGLTNIYIYPGGMFEWLMLQDIYGSDIFKTTRVEKDLLKFKPLTIKN